MINSNRKCSILSVPARAKDCYFIRKGLACSDHKQAEPHPAVGRSVRFRLQNVNTLRSISYRYSTGTIPVVYQYGTIPYSPTQEYLHYPAAADWVQVSCRSDTGTVYQSVLGCRATSSLRSLPCCKMMTAAAAHHQAAHRQAAHPQAAPLAAHRAACLAWTPLTWLLATLQYAEFIMQPIIDSTIDFHAPPLRSNDINDAESLNDFRFRKHHIIEVSRVVWAAARKQRARARALEKLVCPPSVLFFA